jgi:lipopolysaccharide transport system ATP-binding protein
VSLRDPLPRGVTPIRIGAWGTFDLDNFGDMLFPRITRRELECRLPGADVRLFAPYGREHPVRWDGGEPSEPLGVWSKERLAELATDLDCVAIGGGEIIHTRDALLAPCYGVEDPEIEVRAPSRFFIDGLGPELEAGCPTLWSAVGIPFDFSTDEAARIRTALARRPYVAVRDERSRTRLEAAGVEREIDIVPDLGFLLPRLLSGSLLRKRLDYLRLMGWYPPEGEAVIVQRNRDLLRLVPAIASALRRLLEDRPGASLVIAETGPCHGDDEFGNVLFSALPARTYRLPGIAGIEDLTAAIASSAGFIGVSLHGNITAFAYGRPHIILNPSDQSKLDGLAEIVETPEALVSDPDDLPKAFEYVASRAPRPDLLTRLQAAVDIHFDRIAVCAVRAAEERVDGPTTGAPPPALVARLTELERRLAGMLTAHEARGRRLMAERLAFADHVHDLREELSAQLTSRFEEELARLAEEVAWLREVVADKENHIRLLETSRTYRYTAPLRSVYGSIRRRSSR